MFFAVNFGQSLLLDFEAGEARLNVTHTVDTCIANNASVELQSHPHDHLSSESLRQGNASLIDLIAYCCSYCF